MRVLYIAYPLMPVAPDSAGGAEQMLNIVEREIARRGHSTVVAACGNSQAAGELVLTGAIPDEPDRFDECNREHNARVLELIRQRQLSFRPFDLVHDMSGSFWPEAWALDIPVLATLHLPRSFYPASLFDDVPPNIWFNCVSRSQARSFADLPAMLGVVRNGIDLELFPAVDNKADYLLWLGRICEEKGAHLAIRAAQLANAQLILAGQVYPFSYHQQYFEREILPHLRASASDVRWVEAPTLDQKIKLLAYSRAVLVPSLAEETSSLVAMEAMACGTRVIAFARGALPGLVAEGKTGFLVKSVEEMAAAVDRLDQINSEECRHHAEANFACGRMADEYENLYQEVLTFNARQAAA
jgi:glycosyltransferase involved in cell wall biosynthesis